MTTLVQSDVATGRAVLTSKPWAGMSQTTITNYGGGGCDDQLSSPVAGATHYNDDCGLGIASG